MRRQLARDARMMRTGAAPVSVPSGSGAGEAAGGGGGGSAGGGRGRDDDSSEEEREIIPKDTFEKETREEREARRQRDEIRGEPCDED